jgi:hypothetical protein
MKLNLPQLVNNETPYTLKEMKATFKDFEIFLDSAGDIDAYHKTESIHLWFKKNGNEWLLVHMDTMPA